MRLQAYTASRGVNYGALASIYYNRGLVADFDVASLSGLSDGAAVSTWTDATGTYTATQSGSNRPTYSATGWSDGTPCVTMVKASLQGFICDALAALASTGGAFTIVAQVRLSSATDSIVFGFSTGSTTPYRYGFLDFTANAGSPTLASNTSTPGLLPQVSQGTYTYSSAKSYATEDTIVIFSSNGSQSFVWLNGQLIRGALGAQDAAVTYTKGMLFGLNYNGSPHPNAFNGKAKRVLIYNRGFSERDIAAVVYQLGLQSNLRFTMNAVGDSITQGNVAGPAWCNTLTYPTQAILANTKDGTISAQSTLINNGVASRALVYNAISTTNNEAYNAAVHAQYTYLPTVPQILTLFIGTNDPYYAGGTLTGAQLFARYAGVVAQLRAAAPHSYIVAATILNRGNWSTASNYGGSDAPYNLCISDFNTLLRVGYPSIDCDACWDANACSALQTPGTAAATGPNFVDAVHPTTAGQAALGATYPLSTYRLAAVNKLLQLQLVT